MESNKTSGHIYRIDSLDNRASETTDQEHRAEYGATVVEAINTPYEDLAKRIDEVYQSIGARVVRGVSYAGEDPVKLFAPSII